MPKSEYESLTRSETRVRKNVALFLLEGSRKGDIQLKNWIFRHLVRKSDRPLDKSDRPLKKSDGALEKSDRPLGKKEKNSKS